SVMRVVKIVSTTFLFVPMDVNVPVACCWLFLSTTSRVPVRTLGGIVNFAFTTPDEFARTVPAKVPDENPGKGVKGTRIPSKKHSRLSELGIKFSAVSSTSICRI